VTSATPAQSQRVLDFGVPKDCAMLFQQGWGISDHPNVFCFGVLKPKGCRRQFKLNRAD